MSSMECDDVLKSYILCGWLYTMNYETPLVLGRLKAGAPFLCSTYPYVVVYTRTPDRAVDSKTG